MEGVRMGLRRRSGSRATASSAGKAAVAATTKGAAGARKQLTAKNAKRMIGVGTAVAPLLAPFALAAAGLARARWDDYRAARLGVAPDQLQAYSGPGGALHARLSRVAETLTALDSGAEAGAAQKFATETRPRLVDLSIAVRAAEQMPAPRRRAAFRAIGAALDRIESDVLTHLGITA